MVYLCECGNGRDRNVPGIISGLSGCAIAAMGTIWYIRHVASSFGQAVLLAQ
jgi:hypothetical protein